MTDAPTLPDHIEQNIEAVANLNREHHRQATPSQRIVMQITDFVGRPRFAGGLLVVLLLWVGAGAAAQIAGFGFLDLPPFNYLQAASSVASVFAALLVLITQRHESALIEARDQLTLELAMRNEQKSAKMISLIEELRRDLSLIPDRSDHEADKLTQPADPQVVLDAIRSTTSNSTT